MSISAWRPRILGVVKPPAGSICVSRVPGATGSKLSTKVKVPNSGSILVADNTEELIDDEDEDEPNTLEDELLLDELLATELELLDLLELLEPELNDEDELPTELELPPALLYCNSQS